MNADIKKKKRKKFSETVFYKILNTVRSVIFVTSMIISVTVVVFTFVARINGKVPTIFGYSLFRVISGSMEPVYEVGDIIVTKSLDPLTLNEGDIVTYYGREGMFKNEIVTHRVVKAPFVQNGEYYIVTKGDSNLFNDPNVKTSDVIGIVECEIPFLTAIINYYATPWGLATFIILILFAFSNYIIDFVKSLIDFIRENRGSADIE